MKSVSSMRRVRPSSSASRIGLVPALTCALLAATSTAQEAPPGAPEPERWKGMDLEARWVAYRAATAARDKSVAKWVRFLVARRDAELLEWLVLYDGWIASSPEQAKPGDALVEIDAPQWMRAAVFTLGHYDDHNRQAAQKHLLAQAGRVHGWLLRYPVARRLLPAEMVQTIEQTAATDPGEALPPLDSAQLLLPHLDAPGKLEVFGDRLRAERGVVYVHQVLRAIRGTVHAGKFDEPWRGKLLRLTNHAEAVVRREAFLAFTRLPPPKIPWQALQRVAGDAARPAADREAAFLAASFSDAPEAWLALHEAVLDPARPVWRAAVHRLAEVGHAFSLGVLAQARARVDARQAMLVDDAAAKIGKRASPTDAAARVRLLRQVVRHAAWAEGRADGLPARLAAWSREWLREHARSLAGRPVLRELAEDKALRRARKLQELLRELSAKTVR